MTNLFFNRRFTINLSIILGLLILVTSSCCKDPEPDPEPDKNTGKIHLDFDFLVDGNPLEYDTLMYVNAAGNHYLVYEVQYFVTQVTIYQKGGKVKVLDGWEKEHYIDTNIPSTMSWDVYDDLEEGNYDSLSFRFGFIDADNQSFMFVNPPENAMVWPEYSGGGYHYMKIDGKWVAPSGNFRGFAFHIGRGQVYDSNNNPISFIDNSYYVTLDKSNFVVAKGKYTNLIIRMHVDQWFTSPKDYDHNVWGGDIMQNQDAMAVGVENGWNVFELVQP